MKYMIVVAVVALLLLPGGGSLEAQDLSKSTVVQTPSEVAKILAEQGKVVEFPAKEKKFKSQGVKYLLKEVEADVKQEAPVYQFEEGKSRAVLLKLPEYTEPYMLTIWSRGSGFMTLKGFYPTAVVLDSNFAQLPHRLAVDSQIDKKALFLVKIITNPSWHRARYILCYTDLREVGKEATRGGGGTTTVQGGPYTVTGVPVLDVISKKGETGRLKFRKLTVMR